MIQALFGGVSEEKYNELLQQNYKLKKQLEEKENDILFFKHELSYKEKQCLNLQNQVSLLENQLMLSTKSALEKKQKECDELKNQTLFQTNQLVSLEQNCLMLMKKIETLESQIMGGEKPHIPSMVFTRAEKTVHFPPIHNVIVIEDETFVQAYQPKMKSHPVYVKIWNKLLELEKTNLTESQKTKLFRFRNKLIMVENESQLMERNKMFTIFCKKQLK